MRLFDSHCHLDDKAFDNDLDNILANMKTAGVDAAMIVGIHLKSSQKAVAIANAHSGLYASVGVHPHDVKNCDAHTLTILQNLTAHQVVRAWGEIGLDFNRMFSPRQDQEKWFIRQLELAQSLSMPLIFHERDSQGRFLEILKHHFTGQCQGVVHCFSGTKSELFAYLDLGLHIGITGILTVKKRGETLRKLAMLMPPDRMVIETDAPYLTPVPQRNKFRRNEPAFVSSVLMELARIRGMDPQALARILWNNTCRLYGIDSEAS